MNKILLSAHKDVVMHPYRLEYENGKFYGLLDNYIGVLVCNSLMLEEPGIAELEKKGIVKVFYGGMEEWALSEDFPQISKDRMVIVVDVACGEQYKGFDFSIENISGISAKEVKEIKEHLEWESFKVRTKMYDGDPDDQDEAWQWKELGFKVVSFIIPIQAGSKKTGWHVDDCTISIDVLNKAKQGLKRFINHLL